MSSHLTLNVLPLERFAGKNVEFRRPTEIAHFSFDQDHHFQSDHRSLKYYYNPELGANLWEGFDTFKKLDESSDEHLDALLKALVQKERRTGQLIEADVISWRGLMTKILALPYSGGEDFEYNITWFQNTIFIEEDHAYKLKIRASQDQQRDPAGKTRSDRMAFAGYKFETLALLPIPWDDASRDLIESRPAAQVSNHEQYCSVVQTGFGSTRIVIGGEVDAIWDDYPADLDRIRPNYVELKTSELPRNVPQSQRVFEEKLLKYWAQSYLLGVPRIMVGFRSRPPDPKLLKVETFETSGIPAMVRDHLRSWDSQVSLAFFGEFLNFLKQQVNEPGIWKMRGSSSAINLWKVADHGTGDIVSEEFLDWRAGHGRRTPIPSNVKAPA